MRSLTSYAAAILLSLSTSTVSTAPPSEQQTISSEDTRSRGSAHNLSAIVAASPLLSLHRALCEVESISNNELAVAELLVSYLSAHNFSVTTQKVPQPEDSDMPHRERWNVYAVPDPAKFPVAAESPRNRQGHGHDGPSVLLTSHIDTVPPFIPYSLSAPHSPGSVSSFNRSAIQIRGRGTVDAKACVATQIHAVLSLLAEGSISPASTALLFVVGEETSGAGMSDFSDSALNAALNYTTVIFGEPTESKLATGHKGITMLTLTAHGKAAHSGYPWLGRSAVGLLLPALAALEPLGDTPTSAGGLPRSDKYGNTTVNIGFIRAGIAANVVPATAVAKISFRLAAGTPESAREIVTAAVRRAVPESDSDSDSDHHRLDLHFTQGYGPVALDAGVPGFDEITVNYGTDVPNLARREGVRRHLYGPGSILVAHGENEGLSVGELEGAVRGYRRLVLYALGKL